MNYFNDALYKRETTPLKFNSNFSDDGILFIFPPIYLFIHNFIMKKFPGSYRINTAIFLTGFIF
jgi:hypothetical protein